MSLDDRSSCMRKERSWVIRLGSAAGGIAVFALGVSPSDVKSSLSEWLDSIGLSKLAALLSSPDSDWMLAVLGIVVVGFSAYRLGFNDRVAREGADSEQSTSEGDDRSVRVGGDNSGVINTGDTTIEINKKRERHVTPEFAQDILNNLPKDRPVTVLVLNGDSEATQFGREIHKLLSDNDYDMKIDDVTWHMFFNPPVGIINITPFNDGKEWQIVIGPSE